MIAAEDPHTSINVCAHAALDSTGDVVRPVAFYFPLFTLLQEDSEDFLYRTVFPTIAEELNAFYVSNIKLLRMKNVMREREEHLNEEEPVQEPEQGRKEEAWKEEELPEMEQEQCAKENECRADRTTQMLRVLVRKFTEKGTFCQIAFNSLSRKKERRVMAPGFYELLLLASHDYVFIEQGDSLLLTATDRLKALL